MSSTHTILYLFIPLALAVCFLALIVLKCAGSKSVDFKLSGLGVKISLVTHDDDENVNRLSSDSREE